MTAENIVPLRPLLFTRLRLFLGGMAEYCGTVLDEELEAAYRELERLRTTRGPEADVAQAKDEILHIMKARQDITTGLLDERNEFLKVRVYRGGQADTLLAIFQDRQSDLLDELAALRAAGRTEDDEEIDTVRGRLMYVANVLRELGVAAIELAGPDRDPR